MLPDIDVVGMAFGVPYGAAWGHRGATHSLAMAVFVGIAAAAMTRPRGQPLGPRAVLACLVMASHGVLDAMTDGGKGVALLWPFTTRRFFLPWRPIPVAPIGMGFLSSEGVKVGLWELLVFLPLFVFALWPRRTHGRPPGAGARPQPVRTRR
jgi:inner membrane protein